MPIMYAERSETTFIYIDFELYIISTRSSFEFHQIFRKR